MEADMSASPLRHEAVIVVPEQAPATMATLPPGGEVHMPASSIDQVLKPAADRGDVPGVVAVAATRDGVCYEGAFGRRALPEGAVMTADSVFWIASMTKAVTSTAAMQLVEQGRLALDRPIGDVLPELANVQVLDGFDAAGEPRLRAATRPITLRHLMTHTAGFTYDIWNPDTLHYRELKGLPDIFSCTDASLMLPLAFDPGERWEYGINIDWIGKAVERVSGQRLGDYFAEHLFGPIGMADTGFKLTPERRRRLVAMHARGEDDALAPIEFEMVHVPEFEMGGGGLYGSASDYLAFARVFERRSRDRWPPCPPARDCAAYGPECDGRAQFPGPPCCCSLFERGRILSRNDQEMGPRLHDIDRGGARGAQRRQPRLGRSWQHVFLDRPDTRSRRCHPNAAAALADAKVLALFDAL
jgi:CubicO group peptidase (beta-lactamase class C family)